MLSRRALLQSLALASTGLTIGAAAHDIQSDGYTATPVLERLSLTIPNLPPAFNGYRLGFLTDLHLGLWVPQSWITNALNTLVDESVDLLILGGDYIFVSDNPLWTLSRFIRNSDYLNMSRAEVASKAFNDIAQILSAYQFRDGIVGVVGNHEHWNSYERFAVAMKACSSVKVLVNEEISITRDDNSLDILGVDDFLTGLPIKPPERRGPRGKHSRVLVSHNPDYVATLLEEERSSFDLALCGHTHGGQVCIPGATDLVIPVQDPRFLSGLTQVEESFVYTSRGLGVVGLPFRVNCPPEITIVELKST